MTITVLLDPAQMPDQSQDQLDFDNKMAGFMRDLPTLASQINETTAGLNAVATGGAYALPYIFDTATADADPGAGKLRLSSATQSAATVMRLDLTAGGQDYTTLIDTMDGSTSTIKGSIRLVKQGDLSKWMTFDVTARAAPSGYRNLTVVCTDSSAASPFASGDALMLFFQRNGDKGDIGQTGMPLLAAVTLSSAVASIDFTNIFNSLYDKYTIEFQGLTKSSNGFLNLLQLAFAGVVNTGSVYTSFEISGNGGFQGGLSIAAASSTQFTGTIEIRNANGAYKSLECRCYDGSPRFFGGTISVTTAASGFRISAGGGSFTAGVIRVFGHRNS